MTTKNLQPIKQRYGIVGNNDQLNRALDIALQIAPTDLSVLIEGESGVGKEVIPRIIHDHSRRKHQKYFAINCGAIAEGTIDSELFGHEKGAFTSAISEHEGYFAAANGGTLFLDEVGNMPLSTQARLLRVLETGEYIRVGSNQVRKTNVRVIAATNLKMKKAISEGRFREDLYYRLAAVPITMPPLRERGNDIPLLFRKFAADIAEQYTIDPVYLSDEAKEYICRYKWPGNIRELKNKVEQLSFLATEREISVEALQQVEVQDDSMNGNSLVLARDINASTSQHLYENEREMLLKQLFTLSNEIKELKEIVKETHKQKQMERVRDDESMQYISFAAPKPQPKVERLAEPLLDDIETAEAYVEEAPLSIKERYEQSIIDALRRNNNNKRRAAQELGISERTLYRKIKEMVLNK